MDVEREVGTSREASRPCSFIVLSPGPRVCLWFSFFVRGWTLGSRRALGRGSGLCRERGMNSGHVWMPALRPVGSVETLPPVLWLPGRENNAR